MSIAASTYKLLKTLEEEKAFRFKIEEIKRKFEEITPLRLLEGFSLEQIITIGYKVLGEDYMMQWFKKEIPDVYRGEKLYFPTLPYEFIAHLMNEKLITYVVSLNYDELLEKALDMELAPQMYFRCAALEDFEKLLEVEKERWKETMECEYFVIKPHGTISLPSTLCHRYEEVLELEEYKRKF